MKQKLSFQYTGIVWRHGDIDLCPEEMHYIFGASKIPRVGDKLTLEVSTTEIDDAQAVELELDMCEDEVLWSSGARDGFFATDATDVAIKEIFPELIEAPVTIWVSVLENTCK
jgi:hypothetical protein